LSEAGEAGCSMSPKTDKQAEAAARKKAAAEESARRRAEAEARKRAIEEAQLAAAANGLGYSELKGNRGSMEDRVVALRLPGGERFGAAFDGHRGDAAAEFAARHMAALVVSAMSGGSSDSAALAQALSDCHTAYTSSTSDESGATSSIALVRSSSFCVASVGNSRAVLFSSKIAEDLTKDIKPEDLHTGLLGSADEKLDEPQLIERQINGQDAFLVLATDGVWSVLKSQKACEIVDRSLATRPDAPQAAVKALCDAAYNAESSDNIAATVILLHGYAADRGPALEGSASLPKPAAEPARDVANAVQAAAVARPATAVAKPSTAVAATRASARTVAQPTVGSISSGSSSGIDPSLQIYPHQPGERQLFARVPSSARPGDEVRMNNRDGEYLVTVPSSFEAGMMLRVVLPDTSSKPAGTAETHLLRVPEFARAGDRVSVKASWGTLYMLEIPPGHAQGDTFAAELSREA